MLRSLLKSLAAGILFSAIAGDVAIAQHPNVVRDRGLALLKEGRVDEAALLIDLCDYSGRSLVHLANLAIKDERPKDALTCYESYLRLFPFRSMGWEEHLQEEWSGAAEKFIRLKAQIDKPQDEPFRQSLAALELYQQLRKAYAAKEWKEYTRLADEILAKYPRSIFVQPAIMTAVRGRGVFGHSGNFENDVLLLEGYLAAMEKAGITEADRLWVMLMRDQRQGRRQATDGQKPAAPLTSEDVLRLSKNFYLRRNFLRDEIQQRLKGQDLSGARVSIQRFLDEHPPKFREQPRLEMTRACLTAGQLPEAQHWIDQFLAAKVPEASEHLLEVAFYHFRQGNRLQGATQLEALIRDHPAGRKVDDARLHLGQAYLLIDKEAEGIALLKEMAEPPRSRTIRGHANEALARHFTAREDWKLALLYWERWSPESFCATCAEGMEKHREERILHCKVKLNPPK